MDIDKVALDLALRQKIGRVLRTKTALDLSSLQPFIDAIKNNPTTAAGLAGAGLGGLYGVATGDEDDRWQRGLTGALAGGALGTGAMMAGKSINSLFGGGSSPETSSILTPEGERDAVSLAQRIANLQSGGPLSVIGDFVANRASNHPFLTTLAGLDLASNTLGSAAVALDKNYVSRNPNMYRKNIQKILTSDLAKGFTDDQIAALKVLQGDTEALRRAIRRLETGRPIDVDIPNKLYKPTDVTKPNLPNDVKSLIASPTIKHNLDPELMRSFGRDRVQRGGTRAVKSLVNVLKDKTRPLKELLTPKQNWPEWLTKAHGGVTKAVQPLSKVPDYVPSWAKNYGGKALKHVGNIMDRDLVGYSPTLKNRLGARGLLYLGVPALEMLYSNVAGRGSAARELARLESQYAK